MTTADRIFSYLTSPFDIRDYKIATIQKEFPSSFSLPEVTIKDQGSIGSCVAHACSTVVEFHNKRQEGTDTVFSTDFIYGYRPAGYYVGEGMYIREALKTLQKIGDCPLTDLRGNHECQKAMEAVEANLDELKEAAYPHRISTYAKVSTTEEIKQALVDFGYVVVSMPWYKDYNLNDGVYTINSEEISGYHAVVIYGWNENGWLVHNSWGKSWGKKGRFIVPFDFKWREAWAITDEIKNDEVIIPQENIFVKLFGKAINTLVNIYRKFFKKI